MDLMTLIRSQWDRLLGVAFAVIGLIVLIVGWLGVSGTPYLAEQIPYVVGDGLGGLFCLGVAAVLWLSADLHDEWRKLDRLEQALLSSDAEASPSTLSEQYEGVAPFPIVQAPRRAPASRNIGAPGQ